MSRRIQIKAFDTETGDEMVLWADSAVIIACQGNDTELTALNSTGWGNTWAIIDKVQDFIVSHGYVSEAPEGATKH